MPYSTLMRPHLVLHPVLQIPAHEWHGPVTAGPEEGHENRQRAGTSLLREKLRDFGLFSLEMRRLRGDVIAAFQ